LCLCFGKYLCKMRCRAVSHASWQVFMMGKCSHSWVVWSVIIAKEELVISIHWTVFRA